MKGTVARRGRDRSIPGPDHRQRVAVRSAVRVAVTLTLALGVTACSSSGSSAAPTTQPSGATGTTAPPCPTDPIQIVVSVDQWGDVVRHLAGSCATVTTVITGTAGDPHDYEPTAADAVAFEDARLVVVNGLGYDEWANRFIEATDPRPPVVDAGVVVGAHDDDNPHLWYRPDAVRAVARTVTDRLGELAPAADGYFAERASTWDADYRRVEDLVASIRSAHVGDRYAATESVFDPMATAIGLVDVTPPGYVRSVAAESEPAPGDLAAFQAVLRERKADVLIVNGQTEGALVDSLRDAASSAGVPVLEVTETIPPAQPSFVAWQVAQLESLRSALAAEPG